MLLIPATRSGAAAPRPQTCSSLSFLRGRAGAALCLSLLLGACGGGGDEREGEAAAPPPASAQASQQCSLPDFQAELLRLVNEHRARGAFCGSTAHASAPSLAWNDLLTRAAARHSRDMVDRSFFSHAGSDGSSGGERIAAAGYAWNRWGENIAYGYTSSAAVVDGWMKSEGHCRNIMNPGFTAMGLACVRQSDSNAGSSIRWAWTQTLAAR